MTIPSDWRTGLLGDLCSIEIGGTPSRNIAEFWDVAKETNNYWLSIRDLNKRVIHTTSEHISAEGVKNSNVKHQSVGTVLMSFKLSIGRVAYAGIPLYTNEAIAGLRSEVVDHDFLYQGLQHCNLLEGVDQAIKGATLNKAKLKKIKFHYPPLRSEQSKIAEILSTLDQAIEQTEALIAKQQRIKIGLMQDLLTRGIDEHGQLRTEQTHAFKDSPLGRIPVGWEVFAVSNVINGIDAGWSPSCEDVTPGRGEWGVLKVSAISAGVFNPEESKRLPGGLLPLPELEVQRGDVLFSRANGVTELVGRCVYVEETPSQLMLSDKTLRLRPRPEKVIARMLCEQLKAESSRRQILNYISGSSGQKNLSQKQIGSILLALAPVQEQQIICDLLANTSKQFESDEVNLVKTKSLKTALMQDLLTGHKRVTNLLEPIAA